MNGAASSEAAHYSVWRWAQQTPDAVAIRDQQICITYRDLAARADRLALRLRRAGVQREVLVGLSASRSAALVIGALAILRAGGAYVPIDPAYPAERRDFLLQDSQCQVLLTESEYLPLYAGSSARILVLDDEESAQDAVPAGPAQPEAEPAGDESLPQPAAADDSLAYVIYTSGSTGRPKGVCVTQHNLLRLFRQTEAWFHVGPQDRWTLFHSFSFDFSVWEMWGALLYGGCLVIVPFAVSRDPMAFYQLVVRERITVLNQTPSEWQLFQRADALAQEASAAAPAPDLGALRYVMLGGEALDLRRLRPWFERHGDHQPQLINLYGITETSVIITARPLSLRDQEDPRSLIGTAIPDLRLHILDPQQQPVAKGQEGELWVGGAGVTRGYLRRPELTEQRFRPDPFSADPQARLYRTGDLVRLGPDDELEYIGRMDQQIKVGGHRIELGEIESVLRADPALADAAVLPRRQADGTVQLHAYLVGRSNVTLDLPALKQRLGQQLPEYMCPATLCVLPVLPLTVNGKLDRDALLAMRPDDAEPAPCRLHGMEATIAALFQETLARPIDSAAADFFGCGGSSLQAMQLSLKIAERLGVALPVGSVFRCATVAALAAEVEHWQRRMPTPEPQVSAPDAQADASEAEATDWQPLSAMQEQIWFVQHLAPQSQVYHCPVAFRIHGSLDAQRLASSITRLCLHHPLLRAVFATIQGRPMQRIHSAPTFALQTHDLRDQPADARDALAVPSVQELLRRPFHLEQAAGAAFLFQESDSQSLFVLLLHHIITDGWSVDQLLHELSAEYEGRRVNPPQARFIELAAQQRALLAGSSLCDSEEFFRQQLSGAPATSEIVPERPRPATASLQGRLHAATLPASLRQQLLTLAQSEGVTLSTLLFSGLFALLHRYTGQRDLVIGMPYASRDLPGSDAVQGPLLNLLPIRVQIPSATSFRDLLRSVRSQTHSAYRHSALPFSRVRSLLSLQHETSRHPLFQIAYAPQPGARAALTLPCLEIESVFVDIGKSAYDLTLYVWPTQEQLYLELEYASDLYSEATIAQLVGHYQRLLDSASAEPDRPLEALPILSQTERQLLLQTWSGRAAAQATESASPPSVLRRFQSWVRAQPDATAIRFGAEELTYRQLDTWSSRLAQMLRARGVTHETRVALACPRSPAAIVGVLGVWKAGAAYVPLDPAYPESRLRWMLADSGAALLLSTVATPVLSPGTVPGLQIDHPDLLPTASDLASHPQAPLAEHSERGPSGPGSDSVSDSQDALAYVIYTSGSTGIPKGVLIEQRSLAALACVIPSAFPLAAGQRLLQFASLSFDWSVAEILIALTQGGTLVIPTQRFALAGSELVDLLASERIAQVLLPPSVLSQLPEHPLPDLRLLLVGGERCPASLVARWGSQRVLRNAYGPTEATIVATTQDCTPEPTDPAIGRPLPGATVYVLDAAQRLVPPLVPGELYIGGRGLARTYHNRPELSAARFLEQTADVAERLYRTGDIVRFRRDGALEFLGRQDEQRKLRGFRIELGEVEATLRSQRGVQAAVAWIDGEGASARLLGYVVRQSAGGSEPATRAGSDSDFLADLRSALRSTLPPQLVPSDLIILPRLPLTPNGKLDLAALPRASSHAAADVSQLSEWEALVAEVWHEVLGRSVPRSANFFDVGGSSLRLIEVQARLESRLGTRVPLSDLFAHPTIEAMAALIGRGRSHGSDVQRRAEERAARAASQRPQGRRGR